MCFSGKDAGDVAPPLYTPVAPIRRLLRFILSPTGESGQVGTSLALVGLVGTALVLSAVVVRSGKYGAGELDQVFRTSLGRVSGTLELRGSVIAIASGQPPAVDSIRFVVGAAGEGDPVPLDGASTADRLVVSYRDSTAYDADVPYTAREIAGNGDGLLEPGESAQLTVRLADIDSEAGPPSMGPDSRWTLELQAPIGGTVEITRTMPPVLDRVMQLH